MLLGGNDIGGFVYPDGGEIFMYYSDGTAGTIDGQQKSPIQREPHLPFAMTPPPRVAVLIDQGTASSGEGIAVAFLGRKETRFFGAPSAGLSGSNSSIPLSDGAALVLNNAIDIDRDGHKYPDGITPDVRLGLPTSLPTEDRDETLKAAERWLAVINIQR